MEEFFRRFNLFFILDDSEESSSTSEDPNLDLDVLSEGKDAGDQTAPLSCSEDQVSTWD